MNLKKRNTPLYTMDKIFEMNSIPSPEDESNDIKCAFCTSHKKDDSIVAYENGIEILYDGIKYCPLCGEKLQSITPEPEEEITSEFDEGYNVGYSDAITDILNSIKHEFQGEV